MRLNIFRLPATLFLIVVLTLSQTACPGEKSSRDQILGFAQEAVATARDILPVFATAGHSNVHVTRAVSLGEQLVAAFRANRDADAVILTASFIDATDAIAREIDLFKDQAKQTLALAILAGTRIALRRISSYLKPAEDAGALRSTGPRAASARAASKVRDFSSSKHWRCRSSQTGRFQKMEFCRQHPAVSTVERVR